MGNLTPENQRKVEEIMLEAKGFYAAILASDPPASLAFAIRDKKPFDNLSEVEITALFKVAVTIRKAGEAAIAAATAGTSAAGETGNGAAEKPATVADTPPKKDSAKKPEKGGG